MYWKDIMADFDDVIRKMQSSDDPKKRFLERAIYEIRRAEALTDGLNHSDNAEEIKERCNRALYCLTQLDVGYSDEYPGEDCHDYNWIRCGPG